MSVIEAKIEQDRSISSKNATSPVRTQAIPSPAIVRVASQYEYLEPLTSGVLLLSHTGICPAFLVATSTSSTPICKRGKVILKKIKSQI